MISVPTGPYHLTPKPDFNAYDPEDWADFREDPFKTIRPVGGDKQSWYDVPLKEAQITQDEKKFDIKKENQLRMKKKHIKEMVFYEGFSDSEDY